MDAPADEEIPSGEQGGEGSYRAPVAGDAPRHQPRVNPRRTRSARTAIPLRGLVAIVVMQPIRWPFGHGQQLSTGWIEAGYWLEVRVSLMQNKQFVCFLFFWSASKYKTKSKTKIIIACTANVKLCHKTNMMYKFDANSRGKKQ